MPRFLFPDVIFLTGAGVAEAGDSGTCPANRHLHNSNVPKQLAQSSLLP